jgi:hypothetical protein
MTSAAVTTQEPNQYDLNGSGIHVTYATTSLGGQPQLTYQDPQQVRQFSGDEIRTVNSDLGTLVSVTTILTPDAGSTTFTVLIPRVQLQNRQPAHIVTLGIATMHRFTIGPPLVGQLDTYRSVRLTGTAAVIEF